LPIREERNVNGVISMTDNYLGHEANLRENEASIAWEQGRLLWDRGRKFWHQGFEATLASRT